MQTQRVLEVCPLFMKKRFNLYFSEESWDEFEFVYNCFAAERFCWNIRYSISCSTLGGKEDFAEFSEKNSLVQIIFVQPYEIFKIDKINHLHILLVFLEETFIRFKDAIKVPDFIITYFRYWAPSLSECHFEFRLEQSHRDDISQCDKVTFKIWFAEKLPISLGFYEIKSYREVALPYFILTKTLNSLPLLYYPQAEF